MVLYQNGDEGAFGLLYSRHADRVYGYLRKRLNDPQAANDVFQLAFLKLHRSKGQFNTSFMFSPWLFTVVRTVLVDWVREQRPKFKAISFDEQSVAPPTAEEAPSFSRAELDRLPEPQRSAVEMRYFDDMSFAEIAGRLDTSSTNVRQLISRGIKNLRTRLLKGGAS